MIDVTPQPVNWRAVGTLVAILVAACSGIAFYAGGVAKDAVIEIRVNNLERQHQELVTALAETNREVKSLVDYLWRERDDRLRAKGNTP